MIVLIDVVLTVFPRTHQLQPIRLAMVGGYPRVADQIRVEPAVPVSKEVLMQMEDQIEKYG